jgi:hypothetical protein
VAPYVQTQSKYGARLARDYGAADVPIRIIAKVSCDGDGRLGAIVPAIPPGAADRRQLVAYLNLVGSRATVRLLGPSGLLVEGPCQPVSDAVATFYSDVCALPLADCPTGGFR